MQAGKISDFEQRANLRDAPIPDGLQAGDTRPSIVGDQLAGFGELGGGTFVVAFESVGGGQPRMRSRMYRIGVARLFEPGDRLVGQST